MGIHGRKDWVRWSDHSIQVRKVASCHRFPKRRIHFGYGRKDVTHSLIMIRFIVILTLCVNQICLVFFQLELVMVVVF